MLGPYRTVLNRNSKELDIQPVLPTVLRMEQSQIIKFRLFNLSEKPMMLSIALKEGTHSNECLITDVEPSNLGQVDSMRSVDFSL